MSKSTLQEVIVDVLRNSLVPYITWGATASPYYQEVPEPPPVFPYVVFDVPESKIERQFDSKLIEVYEPVIHVIGLEDHIEKSLSPYHADSIFSYLEGISEDLSKFSSDYFECEEFLRTNWVLKKDPTRGPTGERVWIATADYSAIVALK